MSQTGFTSLNEEGNQHSEGGQQFCMRVHIAELLSSEIERASCHVAL